MAFGMEHYFHHKYHSHAEAAHDHKEDVKVDMAKVDAALPAAAAEMPNSHDVMTASSRRLRSSGEPGCRRGLQPGLGGASPSSLGAVPAGLGCLPRFGFDFFLLPISIYVPSTVRRHGEVACHFACHFACDVCKFKFSTSWQLLVEYEYS